MYNLFLDDERIPYSTDKDVKTAFNVTENPIYYTKPWIIVRNYYQFVQFIKDNGLPNTISFDHDLGKKYNREDIPAEFLKQNVEKILNTEMTGYDALKWLCNYCLDLNIDLPEIWLHTANPTGFVNMRDYIKSFNKIRNMKND